MGIRLTYAVRRVCFGLGRIKPELNGKHKLRSLPRESEIVTCEARHAGSPSPTAGRRTSYRALALRWGCGEDSPGGVQPKC